MRVRCCVASGEVLQDLNLDLVSEDDDDDGQEHLDHGSMIFARGRMRRDVSRLRLRSMGSDFERRHDLIHLGFCNYVEYIGKSAVEHGQKMLLVEGRSESESDGTSRIRRWAIHLSGNFYNPKSFETIRIVFLDASESETDDLNAALPLTVKMRERSCEVNAAFEQLDCQSEDKFIFEIEQLCESLFLYSVEDYRIPFEAYDHPNLYTEIQSVKAIGSLYERGQNVALLAAELTARRRQQRSKKIPTSDPMLLVAQLESVLLCDSVCAGRSAEDGWLVVGRWRRDSLTYELMALMALWQLGCLGWFSRNRVRFN